MSIYKNILKLLNNNIRRFEKEMYYCLTKCLFLYEKEAIDFNKFEALFPSESKKVFDEYFRNETAARRLLDNKKKLLSS